MCGTSAKLTLIYWLYTIPFNSGYVHIISSGLTNLYIKNSSDNLTKSLMIHEKCGCLCVILPRQKRNSYLLKI